MDPQSDSFFIVKEIMRWERCCTIYRERPRKYIKENNSKHKNNVET